MAMITWYEGVVDRVVIRDEGSSWQLATPKFVVTFTEYGNTETVTLGETEMRGAALDSVENKYPYLKIVELTETNKTNNRSIGHSWQEKKNGDTEGPIGIMEAMIEVMIEVAVRIMNWGVIRIGDMTTELVVEEETTNLVEDIITRMVVGEEKTNLVEDITMEMIIKEETTNLAEDMLNQDIVAQTRPVFQPYLLMMTYTKRCENENEPK